MKAIKFFDHYSQNRFISDLYCIMSAGRGEESTGSVSNPKPFSVSKLGKWVELTNFPHHQCGN